MLKKSALSFLAFTILFVLTTPYVAAHDLPRDKNLSDYIRPYDSEVIKLAEFIGVKPFLSYPLENARNAYYWVSENIRYRFDNQTWGEQDYWQLPSTTIRLGTGDCEDQAILLASLLRALRLPRENVRVAASYKQRHAWVEIKVPLPIYGLENIAANLLEQLKNKRITISIGESSITREITSDIIDEIKAAGLSHNNGWIPLDTTAKILPGYPVPFSWWLTYGYNVYKILGGQTYTPEITFQDKARIWEIKTKLGVGENLSFEIPCFDGEKILGLAKVINAEKSEVLASVYYDYIPTLHFKTYGGYYLYSGEKIFVTWKADSWLRVYILNEIDLERYNLDRKYWKPFPEHYQAYHHAIKGSLEYVAEYADKYFIVIMEYSLNPVRVYSLNISRIRQETKCNVQVTIVDSEGRSLKSELIAQRNVERQFEFTADKSGNYCIILRNQGSIIKINYTQPVFAIGPIPLNETQISVNVTEIITYLAKIEETNKVIVIDEEPVLLYLRLEVFLQPLNTELFGVNEGFAIAEQQYINEIVKSLEKNTNVGNILIRDYIVYTILSSFFVIIILVIILILKKRIICKV